jgi:hypothetical protein
MTLIIQNHWGIVTGTFTSIIDTFLNLKKFKKDVELITISDHKPSEIIKLFFKNSKFGRSSLMKSFTKECEFDNEIIICSARLLTDCMTDKKIKIRAKKLIVLDSLDLARKKYGIGPDFDLAVNADECIFLINPANKGITKFKEYVYYHKFNKNRLDLKYFPQRKLNYSRSKKKFIKIQEGEYFENIGKGILEHLYKGYIVNYNTDGMFTKDGLFYYLKLFGIDATKNYKPLIIPKSKIQRHLFMNKNDLLLDLL